MLVPSVMLPKLRFRAGSWKREPPPLLLKRDDMVAVVRSVSVDKQQQVVARIEDGARGR